MRSGLRARVFFATLALVAGIVFVVMRATAGAQAAWHAWMIAVTAAVPAAVILSALTVQWVDALVQPMTAAARRLQRGDFDARVRAARERGVGELGVALDQLAGGLSRTLVDLRSERDLLSRILNGMQEGVLLLDRDGNVAMMNPALREMLLLRADSVGQPLLEVLRHAELKELLDRARRAGTTSSGEIELSGLKPRRLLVRATSFRETGGGLLAVFFDVTDIRRLESLRRDFVANVSHELRTPVTAVLSAAETLEGAIERDPAGARRFLAIIERNAARLRQLIEDLLDLSRIESRELRLRPESIELAPFFQLTLGMFRERAEKRSIRLSSDAPPGLDVETDRRALEQIVTNLVDNAVKYCPDGAVITVSAEHQGDFVSLRVRDTGAGIDASHLPRLFERFYRVDAGRSREMGGTGLGLAIVKHLTEALGGNISVESVVGSGTTFVVSLPRVVPRRPRESAASLA